MIDFFNIDVVNGISAIGADIIRVRNVIAVKEIGENEVFDDGVQMGGIVSGDTTFPMSMSKNKKPTSGRKRR